LKKLGIPPDNRDKLVLIALRPEDVIDIDFGKLCTMKNVEFIGSGTRNATNALDIPVDFIYFPDLVNASDIVVSKPGYGIVSEIISLQKPLIYTSRADFPEYDALVTGLQEKAISYFLKNEDFFSGHWEGAISNVLANKSEWPPVAINGAVVAAEIILSKL